MSLALSWPLPYVLELEPRDLATYVEMLDEIRRSAKQAAKQGR